MKLDTLVQKSEEEKSMIGGGALHMSMNFSRSSIEGSYSQTTGLNEESKSTTWNGLGHFQKSKPSKKK